jgi:hypothetical protein
LSACGPQRLPGTALSWGKARNSRAVAPFMALAEVLKS